MMTEQRLQEIERRSTQGWRSDEPKKAHILICEAHPLRAALAEITRLRQERE